MGQVKLEKPEDVLQEFEEISENPLFNLWIAQNRRKPTFFTSSVGEFRMTKNEFFKLMTNMGKLFGACLMCVNEIENQNLFIFKI